MPRKTLTPKGFALLEEDAIDNSQDAFETHLKSLNRSGATITTYRHGVESFQRWLGEDASMFNVDESMGRSYLASMKDAGASSSTVITYWCALRAFYGWATETGRTNVNPFANIKKPKLDETVIPNIPLDDVRSMLSVCLPNEFVGVRDRAIISLLFTTGMRRGELVGLKVDDYDRKSNELTVLGKGHKFRRVYVDEATRVHLHAYLRIRKLHGLADTTKAMWLGKRGGLNGTAIGQMLTRRANQANVSSKINPHAWRHTYAHNFLDAGGQQASLVANGGWRNHRMIDVYAKADANSRAMRESARLNLGGMINGPKEVK
jgi:site-specific recombinase XerD